MGMSIRLSAALLVLGAGVALAQAPQARIQTELDPHSSAVQHVGIVQLGADTMELVLVGGLRQSPGAPCYDAAGKRLPTLPGESAAGGSPWRIRVVDLALGDVLHAVDYSGPLPISNVTSVLVNVELPGGPAVSACNPPLAIIRRRQ